MMKQQLKFKLIISAIILLAYSSCQKVIDINTNNAAPAMVIEGNLTDIYGGQTVTITKSVPFTSTNTYPPVTGAKVVLSDSLGRQAQFLEKSPGVYYIDPLVGSYGMTYTLTVTSDGKVYTASSTMPLPVFLDSLTSTANQFTNTKNARTIIVNYQDPPKVTNQYKFNLYINNAPTITIFTNDDSFSNGRYVREQLFQNDEDILSGDTVKVELQCIDKNIYQYWFALSQLQINGPGGGITPSNPPSNFNNGALGYFSAHTSSAKVLVLK